jgi:hypothetical protein
VEEFLGLIEQRAALAEQLRAATVTDPAVALKFLQPGRLLRLAAGPPDARRPLPQLGPVPPGAGPEDDGDDKGAAAGSSGEEGSESMEEDGKGGGAAGPGPGLDDILQLVDGAEWGVLVSFEKAGKLRPAQGPGDGGGADGDGSDFRGGGSGGGGPRFVVDVLVNCDPATLPRATGGARALPRLLAPGDPAGVAHVVTLPLEHVAALSSMRMRMVGDLRSAEVRQGWARGGGREGSRQEGKPPGGGFGAFR